MANNVTFDMSGLDELEKALKELDNVTQKKVLRRAVREGAKPVLDEALSGVRNKWGERSGALHDSVKLKTSAPKNKKWADMIASVGVFRIRALEPLADAWYPGGYIGAPTLAYFLRRESSRIVWVKNRVLAVNRVEAKILVAVSIPACQLDQFSAKVWTIMSRL